MILILMVGLVFSPAKCGFKNLHVAGNMFVGFRVSQTVMSASNYCWSKKISSVRFLVSWEKQPIVSFNKKYLQKITQQGRTLAPIYINKFKKNAYIMCYVLYVVFHISCVTNVNSHSHWPYPTLTSRMLTNDPKTNKKNLDKNHIKLLKRGSYSSAQLNK